MREPERSPIRIVKLRVEQAPGNVWMEERMPYTRGDKGNPAGNIEAEAVPILFEELESDVLYYKRRNCEFRVRYRLFA